MANYLEVQNKRNQYAKEAYRFYPPSEHGFGNTGDAVRHAYVSARFTQEYGEGVAKFLGDVRERIY